MDLVTLAIRTNNIVIQGQFPGNISDQVSALLDMCKEINDQYVIQPPESSSDIGSSTDG
jgi:hypothetical protein